jgi:predicted nucleic acid-binding Zn ribbon protein
VRPVRLDRGVLLVEVDDPAWATQVRLLEDQLRTRLQDVAGVSVERIELRVGRRR